MQERSDTDGAERGRSVGRPRRRATIGDVAAQAGVSKATVSRVMNASRTVDPVIAERVRQVAADLEYRPSAVGRSLVLGRTETVGVVVPDLANPTFQELLRALSRAAAADDYRLLFADSSESPREEAILAADLRRHCDGVVLAAPRLPAEELATEVERLGPAVLYNRPGEPGSGAAVDYAGGILALARHLYELGHRQLVFVAGPSTSVSNRIRLAALREFETGHAGVRLQVVPGGVDFAAGYDAAEPVLATGATAAVAFNDLVAMGLLSGVHERGVDVPGQLAITGFDDIPFSGYTTPPLTTCHTPVEAAARACWAHVRALLAGEEPPPEVLLPVELRVRASTGGAAAAAG